jgi:hypothetical protein
MTGNKNILEEYKKGDLDKRLNLFMECPSLRKTFLEIDQSERAREPKLANTRKVDLEVRGS